MSLLALRGISREVLLPDETVLPILTGSTSTSRRASTSPSSGGPG
jgi:hypothetical protein